MHIMYQITNFQSFADDIKNARWIPFYPRLFSIFTSASISIISVFLLGKWFLVCVFEVALLLCDSVILIMALGLGYDDWQLRWVTGWKNGNKPGVGMRDGFLRSLGLTREEEEVKEFYRKILQNKKTSGNLDPSILPESIREGNIEDHEGLENDYELQV